MRRALWLILVPTLAFAQQAATVETTLPFDAPESWAMKYFTAATLLTGNGPPPKIEAGSLRIGLEVDHLPKLSIRQRTVGFAGTKTEDLNKLGVLVRPRITVGLPFQWSVELGIVPPVQINGVRPNLFALALGRPISAAENFNLGVRVYGQVGGIDGDFTCSRREAFAGTDPDRNPFACEAPSSDRLEMRYVGAELGTSVRIVRLRNLTPHLLIAGNYFDNSFAVRARYGGIVDRTLLRTHGFTVSGAGGLTLPVGKQLSLTAQVFYSPQLVRRPPVNAQTVDGLLNARFHAQWLFF